MPELEYYTSERFIWDAVIKSIEDEGIPTLYRSWRTRKKISPFIITWPATAVSARLGKRTIDIDAACLRELDEGKSKWREQMVEAIKLTNAYAICLVQQRAYDVLVILEAHHGVKNWLLPIIRSGDVDVLGPVRETAWPLEDLKLLWSPDHVS